MTPIQARDHYAVTFLRQRRITLLAATIIWTINAIPDWILHNDKPFVADLIIIRLAICLPAIAGCFAATYAQPFRTAQFSESVMLCSILIVWLGTIAMQWQLPAAHIVSEFSPAFSQIAVFFLCIGRLRFRPTLLASGVCFGTYCIFVLLQITRDQPADGSSILINAIQNIAVLFVLGLIANRHLERHYESERVALQQIEKQNSVLADALTMTQQLRQQAEDAFRDKANFLIQASHDLRQPMQAIGILVAVLKSESRDPRTSERVSTLERATRSLDDLFRSMLDINRLEASVIKVDKANQYLPELVEELASENEHAAKAKGLFLKFYVRNGLWAYTDAVILRRIVRNLVNNAVAYTDKGGVFVALRRSGNNGLIQVWDTGTGIAEQQLEEIFEPYTQVGLSEKGARKGLGLGLAIVKGMSKLISVKISVRSQLGRGSVFTVMLPLMEATPELRGQQTRPPHGLETIPSLPNFDGTHILILENEPDVLDALAELLITAGANVTTARNSTEMKTKLETSLIEPTLMLLDIELGGGDSAWHAIDAAKHLGFLCPVLLMTAAVGPEQRLRAEPMGVEIIQKPFNPDQLFAMMRSLLRQKTPSMEKR